MKFLLFAGFLLLICHDGFCMTDSAEESGAFSRQDGSIVIMAPFDLGDGQPHFVFVDFRTGYIRILKQEGSEFTAGPTLFSDSPIELRVQPSEKELHFQINGSADQAVKIGMKEEPIQFRSGDINLAGTLFLPSTTPRATIVLLHGSGPLTRYSFGPIPYFFAASGFAVLVYDKRGTGQSKGDMDSATLDLLSQDGAAAVAYLKTRKDIDSKRIGLWGSSQGGFLAATVAAKSSDVKFLIDQSGMYVSVWRQEIYRTKSEMEAQGFKPEEIATALQYLDEFFKVARTGKNWEQLKARMNSLKNEKWFDLVAKADDLKSLRWYWETLYSYDPEKNLEKVSCPVLGIFGGLDRSTPVPETIDNMKRALRKAKNSAFDYRIYPEANHGLLEAKTGSEREIPNLKRLVPEAFEYQRDWISEVSRR